MKRKGTIVMGPDGDCEISWTEDQNEKMVKFIDDRMKRGWMFFLIDDAAGKVVWTPLASATDSKATRRVSMVDPIAEEATSAGAQVSRSGISDASTISTRGRAKTAQEAAANDTVAFRAARGG